MTSYREDSTDPAGGAHYSSSSAPRSNDGGGGRGPSTASTSALYPHREPSPPNRAAVTNPNNYYQRSPLEFQGQHISFLPPHVIESLRPYYKNSASSLPPQQQQNQQQLLQNPNDRPRPPSFVFAPKYIDSGNVPQSYIRDGVAGPVPTTTNHFSPPADSAYEKYMNSAMNNSHHQQQQNQNNASSSFSTSGYPMLQKSSRYGYDDERGNVTAGTQTTYDPNANVSYVDISASNAVLQRRVERLEQQLEESIQQKEKLNQVIKSLSYAIVPPLAFLPKDFYEKNKSVIDTCADYAMLYRTALRATPAVGGDLDSFEKKLEELGREHLMDRVVCLTSEVMNLRKLVVNMERVQALSP